MDPNTLPTPEALQTLRQMAEGYRLAQAVHVAAKLGIADMLVDGPRAALELAQRTDTHAPSLYRLLRGLASAGVLTENDDQQFALTPVGAGLRRDVPGSWRAMTLLFNAEPYQAWANLLQSVKTGASAFDYTFGMGWFSYVAQHPETAHLFNEAMTARSFARNAAILAAYDFARFDRVMDIGGGHGSLLAAVLQAHPRTTGVLFDLPEVITGAGPLVAAQGVADRCELVAGDFFAGVPAGGDAYLLATVIHDWSDDDSIAILRQCRQAIAPDGKLLLIELIVPATNQPSGGPYFGGAYSYDLHMMVINGPGRERTAEEYRTLLDAAGFRLTQVIPTQSPYYLVEGEPA